MGRLIDIDVLFDYFGNDAINETTRSNIEYFVSEKGTVEAIPKAEYETRLKTDMAAILEEIQLEIEENSYSENVYGDEYSINKVISTDDIYQIIQQKINTLKSESEDK